MINEKSRLYIYRFALIASTACALYYSKLALAIFYYFFYIWMAGIAIVFVTRRSLDENHGTMDYYITFILRVSRYIWNGFKGKF